MPSSEAEQQHIGAVCKAVREMRGMAPDDAASKLGISRSHLANIEAGRRKLTEVLVANMASLYRQPQIVFVRPDLFETVDVAAAEPVTV